MLIDGYANYNISDDGVVTNTKTSRILKPDIIWDGYERVTLSQNGVVKRFRVHRLVAEHYIPNPDKHPMVNHKDGDKRNNSVTNLEWVTCKQNTIHAFATGLRLSGENHVHAKLSKETVKRVCELIQSGLTRSRILERVPGVNKTQFDDIRRRKSWRSVSDGYSW
jgi:HNH endonuclease